MLKCPWTIHWTRCCLSTRISPRGLRNDQLLLFLVKRKHGEHTDSKHKKDYSTSQDKTRTLHGHGPCKQQLTWPQLRRRKEETVCPADEIYTVRIRGLWVDANTWYVPLSGYEIIWGYEILTILPCITLPMWNHCANTAWFFYFVSALLSFQNNMVNQDIIPVLCTLFKGQWCITYI